MRVKKDISNGVKKKFKTKEEKDIAKEELKGLEDLPLVGGLIKGLGKFIDLIEKVEEAGGEIKRMGEIKGLGEKTKGIYGFSIKTGIGGRPKIQTFGNIRPVKEKAKPEPRTRTKFGTGLGFKITEEREPIVDVFDEQDYILIVAELPGINEKEINIILKGDILILTVSEEEKRKYYKEILLPSKVKAETEERIYKNGVLEIKFKKVKRFVHEDEPKGEV